MVTHGYKYYDTRTRFVYKPNIEIPASQVLTICREIDSLCLKFKMNWLELKVETSQADPKVKTGWSSSKFKWIRGQGESMKVKTSLHRPKLKPIQCMSKV